MATHRMSILNRMIPDTSGNVWFEPAALSQPTNDRYPQMVLRYKNTATKDGAGGNFRVPKNYASAPKFYVLWATTATSGDAIWDLEYTAIAKTAESVDPSADQEGLTVTTAAQGTTQLTSESSVSATAGNFTIDDLVQFKLSRDGASADTIGADIAVYDVVFEYSDI